MTAFEQDLNFLPVYPKWLWWFASSDPSGFPLTTKNDTQMVTIAIYKMHRHYHWERTAVCSHAKSTATYLYFSLRTMFVKIKPALGINVQLKLSGAFHLDIKVLRMKVKQWVLRRSSGNITFNWPQTCYNQRAAILKMVILTLFSMNAPQ